MCCYCLKEHSIKKVFVLRRPGQRSALLLINVEASMSSIIPQFLFSFSVVPFKFPVVFSFKIVGNIHEHLPCLYIQRSAFRFVKLPIRRMSGKDEKLIKFGSRRIRISKCDIKSAFPQR